MKKIALVLNYFLVLSVMIMGFNQAIITIVIQYPHELLDVMTIGSGLFVLLIGIINLTALTICNKGILILSIAANLMGALYMFLLNVSVVGASSFVAIIPFVLLCGFNAFSIQKLPKVAEKPLM